MDAITIRNMATVIIALIAAGACFSYTVTDQRRKAKKPVYAVAGLCFLYFAGIYAWGVWSPEPVYLLRSGWLGAIGQYMLAALFVALLITDWRKHGINGS